MRAVEKESQCAEALEFLAATYALSCAQASGRDALFGMPAIWQRCTASD